MRLARDLLVAAVASTVTAVILSDLFIRFYQRRYRIMFGKVPIL